MKLTKITALLLALITLLSLFTACGGTGDDTTAPITTDAPQTTDPITDPPITTEPAPTEPVPYVVEERYISTELYDAVERAFATKSSDIKGYTLSTYVTKDTLNIRNARVKAIYIPIYKTKTMDINRDFYFTLSVFGYHAQTGLTIRPRRQYILRLNADEFQLKNNQSVYRWIRYDLSDYNIILAEDETFGFSSSEDTIIPAFCSRLTSLGDKFLNEFPYAVGFYTKVGTKDLAPAADVLFFDFEFERTYESEDAYKALVAEDEEYEKRLQAVKEIYKGKQLSVMGDSISTFKGISNSASYNKTLTPNHTYYHSESSIPKWQYTYWGRVIGYLDMKLCVNNSWSGGDVYGSSNLNYVDAPYLRVGELDNDNKTPNNAADDIDPRCYHLLYGHKRSGI